MRLKELSKLTNGPHHHQQRCRNLSQGKPDSRSDRIMAAFSLSNNCRQYGHSDYMYTTYGHSYGWPFPSIPRTLTATSNFKVDGFISISSTSRIWCRRVGGFISISSTSKIWCRRVGGFISTTSTSKHKFTFDTAF